MSEKREEQSGGEATLNKMGTSLGQINILNEEIILLSQYK